MADFYKGFVYELDVASKLTIEGRVIKVEETATEAERHAFAQKLIDQSSELAKRGERMEEHKKRLLGPRSDWDKWRQDHPEIHPMLADADLRGAQLEGVDLSYANLTKARLQEANLSKVNFHQAILAGANLTGANLSGANLCRTDLYETIFNDAILIGTNLQGVQLVRNDFTGARVVDCKVYGLSAWDLKMRDIKEQKGFVVRYRPTEGAYEREITVKDLELAGFTYLALNNKNLTRLFNNAGEQWVLLLGRFSKRKEVLEGLAERLKERFIPIIFDFPRPNQRDLIETVLLLAGLSHFVIVELTDAESTPLELQTIVPNYAVPIVPIVLKGRESFSMFAALGKFDWVLPLLTYDGPNKLFDGLQKAIIEPAIAKAQSLTAWKARELQTRDIDDYLGGHSADKHSPQFGVDADSLRNEA